MPRLGYNLIMPSGNCHLCGKEAELQNSHVLPAFVFRWLRETSGTGFIRSNAAPNRRVQDGLKRYWLCSACEQNFGRNEKSFADWLFYPFLQFPDGDHRYAQWMMRFCVSVSWRVLHYFDTESEPDEWSEDQRQQIRRAELAWREYLLGERPRPGEFAQHFIPVDRVGHATFELESNINRYLMRAVDLDLLRGESSILTYAKLGRFVIIGAIRDPNAARWKGTKVHPSQGAIRPRNFSVPESLFEYFNYKANHIRMTLESISPAQRQKMDRAFRENIERYRNSDAFKALHADVEMFGNDAFSSSAKKLD